MTFPAPHTPDRRSQRTRDALRDALLELMTELGWDGVSVQNLCERANVGRSTFYLHYTSKDELLQDGFRTLQLHLQTMSDRERPEAGANTAWRGFVFSRGLIEHAYDNRTLFRSLIGRRSGLPVQQRFREMVLRLIDQEFPAPTGDLPRAAMVRQLAAALTELMAWSVELPEPMPAERLGASFDRLAVAMLHLD